MKEISDVQPPGDALAELSAQGHVCEAIEPPARLRSITRKWATKETAEIIADVRGR